MFLEEQREIISKASPGSALEPPPGTTCPKHREGIPEVS